MKSLFNLLVMLQTMVLILLNGPQGAEAEVGQGKEPIAADTLNAPYKEMTGINSGKNELAALNKRTVISATVLGAGIGAVPGGFTSAYFLIDDLSAPAMLVGAGSGALMGFATSSALVKIQPKNAGTGLLLGLGLGTLGGFFSGAAAGMTLINGDLILGFGVGGLGGSVTGLLSGAIFCSIYGYKAGKYSSDKNTSGIEATMGLPRIGFVRASDGRTYAQYEVTIVTLAF